MYYHQEFVDGISEYSWPHVQHCLNLLHQEALCQADLTLKPGDFVSRNFMEDRLGAMHVCHDWTAVYKELKTNWDEWAMVRKEKLGE